MSKLRFHISKIGQSMLAFLFSRDALIFCLFILFAFGIWFVHQLAETPKNTHMEKTEQEEVVYTEKEFTFYIRTRGVPANEDLILFPSEVSVTARIATKHFSELTKEDFRVVCTYPTTPNENVPIPVEVSCSSPYVTQFSVYPTEVEYLIENKR